MAAFSKVLDSSWQPGDPPFQKLGSRPDDDESSPFALSVSDQTFSRYGDKDLHVEGKFLVAEHRLASLGELPLETGARLKAGITRFEIRSAQKLSQRIGFTLEQQDLEAAWTQCQDLLVYFNRELSSFYPVRTRRPADLRQEGQVSLPLPRPAVVTAETLFLFRNLPPGWSQKAELWVVRDCQVRHFTATLSADRFRLADQLAPSPGEPVDSRSLANLEGDDR